jgi:phosphoenolpyruvate---glycerone phosphotransferase subunit DhaK
LFGNYNGDKFNFRLAAEMAEFEHDIKVASVVAGDDIAAAAEPDGSIPGKRRGVAGIFFAYKCAGAAAKSGLDLEGVKNVALEACRNVRTLGVALSACILPRVGKPGFRVAEDEIEIGMGIHGEPGIRIEKMKSSDEIVDDMMGALLADLACAGHDEVAVLVNGLGSTPLDELYIMMGRVAAVLAGKGIKLYRSFVGEYATSMEMSGASISLFKLSASLKPFLDAAADTPFFKQFRLGE